MIKLVVKYMNKIDWGYYLKNKDVKWNYIFARVQNIKYTNDKYASIDYLFLKSLIHFNTYRNSSIKSSMLKLFFISIHLI